MIVVPTLSVRDKGDEPIVGARITGFVVAIAEQVRQRVHRPGSMKHEDGANGDSPYGPAGRVAKRFASSSDEVPDHSANGCYRDGMD